MSVDKKTGESLFKEFELDMKTISKTAEISNCGRSSNDGKPLLTHVTLRVYSAQEANALTSNKYYRSQEKILDENNESWYWDVFFVRHY